MAKQEPESKTFNLREAEAQLLRFTQLHQQAIFSGILSTIAMDRFSYKVTERTQFQLNAELTELTMTELPEVKEESPIKAA